MLRRKEAMDEPKEAEAVRVIGTREQHARLLLGSYRRLTGKMLVEPRPGQLLMEAIDEAPIVYSPSTVMRRRQGSWASP